MTTGGIPDGRHLTSAVRCPTCDAVPRQRCRDDHGRPLWRAWVHSSRQALADEAVRRYLSGDGPAVI